MAKKKYKIVGRVERGGQGVPNVRVEAWDKDLIWDDLIASAVTAADGGFRMQFDVSSFADLFVDSSPDLYFKVYDGGQLIASTEDSVLWNAAAGEIQKVIEVGAKQPKGTQQPKGNTAMPKNKTGTTPKGVTQTPKATTGKTPKPGPKPGPKPSPKGDKYPKGGKSPKGKDKKGKGKKKGGKTDYQPSGSDFVCVIISKKCALELATAISLALGFPITPGNKKKKKKKKGKDKKGKGGKGGGKTGGGKTGGGKSGGGKTGGKTGGTGGGTGTGGGKTGGGKKKK